MRPFLLFCSSLLLLGATSCHSASGSASTGDSSTARATDTMVTHSNTNAMANDSSILPSADADFLKNAATGGMMEVELGKIAQRNASRTTIKEFGALMVKDHGMGGDKIKSLAASKNYALPDSLTDKQSREKDRLQKKTGNDFDRDYVKMMVDDHKEDIKDFEKEATNGKDPDIKTFAENTLRMLHRHLDKAQAIEAALK